MPADPTRGEERKDAAEVLAGHFIDALFASLPPDSEWVVIRRSDRAVMGLEPLKIRTGEGSVTALRLVDPGSPTVGEEGNDGD